MTRAVGPASQYVSRTSLGGFSVFGYENLIEKERKEEREDNKGINAIFAVDPTRVTLLLTEKHERVRTRRGFDQEV